MKSSNPYSIVRAFEERVAEYTGAPFAVSVDSCTNAIFLSLMFHRHKMEMDGRYDGPQLPGIVVPRKTYLSVPMSIIHAGFIPVFQPIEWSGTYDLFPTPVVDAAKRFTSGMYIPGRFMCLSFHIKKHLKLGKGGMILTDDEEAVKWLRRARYEGRGEVFYKEDVIDMLGWNMYMTPQQAAHGLALMQNFPLNNPDIPEGDGYRDLTEFPVFKKYI